MAEIPDSHVYLFPESLTNPSDKYRLVKFQEWENSLNGDGPYAFEEFATWAEVDAECAKRNATLGLSHDMYID